MWGWCRLVVMLLVLGIAEVSWSEVKVNVGSSASDLNEAGAPARFHVTWPRDATTTWSFDIAATAAGLVSERIYLGPTVEYHRNTQIDAPQDAFRLGATSILVLGDIGRGAAAQVQSLAAYQRDALHEVTAHGVLLRVATTPLLNRLAIDRRVGPDEFKLRWRPGLAWNTTAARSPGSRSRERFEAMRSCIWISFRPIRISAADSRSPSTSKAGWTLPSHRVRPRIDARSSAPPPRSISTRAGGSGRVCVT